MKRLTILGQFQDISSRTGISVAALMEARERAAELDLAGLLAALRPAGACEAPIPLFGKTCGEKYPAEPARRVRGAWACDLHICHECPATAAHVNATGHEARVAMNTEMTLRPHAAESGVTTNGDKP